MALPIGISLGRIILIVGAGYTGTVLFRNGKISGVLGELQNLIKSYETSGETDAGDSDVMAAQVRMLAMEVRQLSSARSITVLNGNSSGNFTSLIMTTAAVGALGYGYMRWKGLSFSDLMYVTKKSMTNAVSNLTKHLEHVSEALASTKRHLTQRIENVDGKLNDQMEMSKLLRNEVNDVRGDLSEIGADLEELQRMVFCLDDRLLSFESKQELTNAGIKYLCSMTNTLQEHLKIVGNSTPSLMGLKELADSLPQGNSNRYLTDGIAEEGPKLKDPPRSILMRTASTKC